LAGTYHVPVAERDQVRAGLAAQLVSMCFGVPVDDIRSRGRLDQKSGRARRLALYLAHVGYGWPIERVGHVFGVSRATVGEGCRWTEDARTDPALDGLLDRLTDLVRDVCESPRLDLDAGPAS
jgi:chromosomal replication initiation ATPase DnaA